MSNNLVKTVNSPVSSASLWNGAHKIPWNDPVFSARILREHLSQDHQLASRKTEVITAQIEWIHANYLAGISSSPASTSTTTPMNILDLGCGPGLYSRGLAADIHKYTGLDFGPASIKHAQQEYTIEGRCEFVLGDVVEADFGTNHDLVMMIYGELNVFSPYNCRKILVKAYSALASGGTLLIEAQSYDVIKGMAESGNSWSSAEAGLFTESPHICLTENNWLADESTSLQQFHVITDDDNEPVTYRNTTKAWTEDELKCFLREAGFSGIHKHTDWPNANDGLMLFSARKG